MTCISKTVYAVVTRIIFNTTNLSLKEIKFLSTPITPSHTYNNYLYLDLYKKKGDYLKTFAVTPIKHNTLITNQPGKILLTENQLTYTYKKRE